MSLASKIPIILAILSACLHAFWNAHLKKARHKDALITIFSLFGILSGVVIIKIAHLELPKGEALSFSLAAGLFEGLYFVFLGKALSAGSLSTVYPTIRSLALMLTWTISAFWLGERTSVWGMLALVLILIGLNLFAKVKEFKNSKALQWSFFSGAAVCGYHISYGLALRNTGASPVSVFTVSMCLAVGILILSMGKNFVSQVRDEFKTQKIFQIFIYSAWFYLSFLVFLTALARIEAGLALSLRNLSVGVAIVLGVRQGERLETKSRWALMFLLLGVFILSVI